MRRVRRGSLSSELLMCGRCMYIAHVCFYVSCSDCGGGHVGMFVVYRPLLKNSFF